MNPESIRSLSVALERAMLALAQRSDVEGEKLRHDVRGVLAKVVMAATLEATLGEREQLCEESRDVLARVKVYAVQHGLFLAREGEESSDAIAAAHAAIRGPGEDVTLVPCPACVKCSLCGGDCMVTATVAEEWKAAQEEE